MTMSRRKMLIGGASLLSASAVGTQLVSAQTPRPNVPDGAIVLVAKLQAKPGSEQTVEKALIAMVAPTRKEKGCLCYNLHKSKTDPATFMFYEQWASQVALDAHGQSAHMRIMRAATKGKLAKGDATKYQFIA